MNFLEDKQFQEILQLAVDKKIEDLAVPMIQFKSGKEIAELLEDGITVDVRTEKDVIKEVITY